MACRDVTLSVVVPAHDEAPNLERLLHEVHDALDPGGSPVGADRRRRRQHRRHARGARPSGPRRRPAACGASSAPLRPDGGAERRLPGGGRLAHRDARRRSPVSAGRAAGAARGDRRCRPRLRHPCEHGTTRSHAGSSPASRTPSAAASWRHACATSRARCACSAPTRSRGRRSQHAALRGSASLAPRAVHPGGASGDAATGRSPGTHRGRVQVQRHRSCGPDRAGHGPHVAARVAPLPLATYRRLPWARSRWSRCPTCTRSAHGRCSSRTRGATRRSRARCSSWAPGASRTSTTCRISTSRCCSSGRSPPPSARWASPSSPPGFPPRWGRSPRSGLTFAMGQALLGTAPRGDRCRVDRDRTARHRLRAPRHLRHAAHGPRHGRAALSPPGPPYG